MDDDDDDIAMKLFPSYPGDDLGLDSFKNEIDDACVEVFRTSSFTQDSVAENLNWENRENIEDFSDFKIGFNTASSQKDDNFYTKEKEVSEWPIATTPLNNGLTNNKCLKNNSLETKIKNDNRNCFSFDDDFVVKQMCKHNRTKKVKIISVEIMTKKTERRFGFSVVGGCDEPLPPIIDGIDSGSPAEQTDLQLGDEILDVNGESLENFTHAEIISFIHSCIKSRCIRLRVKRKPNRNLAGTSSLSRSRDFEKVQDAYIIAVEDEARKRLEKLSTQHRVIPLDMTKLGVDNISDSYSDTFEESVDSNSVLRTTVSMPVNSKGQHVGNGHLESSDMNGFMEAEIPKKGKNRKEGHSSRSSSNTDGPLIEKVLQAQNKGRSQNSINRSHDSLHEAEDKYSDVDKQFSGEMQDPGPHREMAIDCPEDFFGSLKSQPKYPPPQSQTSSSRSTPRAPPSTPSKSAADVANNKAHTDSTLESVVTAVSNGHQNQPLREDQIERLRKHQEELRKRREEENRIQKEQEFLRTSLRGSKKLQALESSMKHHGAPAGVVNNAFEEIDDEMDNDDDGFGSARAPSEKDKYMKKNISVDDLFSSLQHIQSRLNAAEERDELAFLKNLYHNEQFQNAVQIHNKVVEISTRSPPCRPTCATSVQASNEMVLTLQYSQSPYAAELMDLLSQHGLRNLLRAHDRIAEEEMKAAPQASEDDFMDYPIMHYGEDTVKIVHLEKTNEPLGATVRNDGDAVVIGRIVKGGTAEKSGLLHEGDEILEVNGTEMKGKNINDVSDMLADMTGTITFMIIPNSSYAKQTSQSEVMHVKALFDYDPVDDILIPCRELGISFFKGDILHVINQDDGNWWQAYREGEEEHQSLAGLIPSRNFREQVEASKHTLATENKENQKKSRSCACGRREKKRKKKAMYRDTTDENEEVLTYEEVSRYFPQPNRKRPVVLIGPPNVGRQELRQWLMDSDHERFAAAVPHTSRPQEANENDGKDYHFVPRPIFEADIIGNKFIEHGEYQKNLYGTSLHAVRQVINHGKICILNLHAETLRLLKNSDLKPYVILVYPQNMEKLRQIQQKLGVTKITDEDLKDSVERAREMEDKYGHYFDFILVVSDMDRAYDELLAEINRIEVEPQWVPSHWVE